MSEFPSPFDALGEPIQARGREPARLKIGIGEPDPEGMRNATCRLVTLAAAAGWLCGAVVAGAQAAGGQCEGTQPSVQTVQLVVVASPAQVAKAPGTLSQAPVVARDASTVVFADGRVVTSDVESASRHLNELGWGDRRVEFVASFKRSGPRRRKG